MWKMQRVNGGKTFMTVSPEISKGCRIEKREHPQLTTIQAMQIARDHIKENPNYYRRQSI